MKRPIKVYIFQNLSIFTLLDNFINETSHQLFSFIYISEAEYAFKNRKTIVPLRMEQGYQADGWLGIIIGAKKFYDFSGKYTFDSRTEDLMKELRLKFGSDHEQIVPQQAMEVYSQVFTSSNKQLKK